MMEEKKPKFDNHKHNYLKQESLIDESSEYKLEEKQDI